MNFKLLIFTIIAGLALTGVALWKFAPSQGPSATLPITSPPGGEIQNQVSKFVIEGDEFSFSPKSITVARGVVVELTFKNIGRVPHNYIIDGLGIATKTIGGGKTDVVTFTAPDSAGTITYASYCSVPGHREAGMAGTIEIK